MIDEPREPETPSPARAFMDSPEFGSICLDMPMVARIYERRLKWHDWAKRLRLAANEFLKSHPEIADKDGGK